MPDTTETMVETLGQTVKTGETTATELTETHDDDMCVE